MTQVQQVLGSSPGTGNLIDTHYGSVAAIELALDDHEGRAGPLGPHDLQSRVVGSNHHHALHSDRHEVLHRTIKGVARHLGEIDRTGEKTSIPGGFLD
jgi:hypothetical protein